MSRPVAIVGTGQTDHAARRRDVNIGELIHEAVSRCLEDAGMTIDQIDAVLLGNMEHFEGNFFVDMQVVDYTGACMKHALKVTTGGTSGSTVAQAGYYHVASGLFDTVLTIGWEKQSDGDTTAGLIFQADPWYERPTMSGAIGTFALAASMYMERHGVTEEQAARVAVKNRGNACRNPHAHLKIAITVEDVLKSRVLAHPIKLLDMCPASDGACALIFTSEDLAPRLAPQPAWVRAAVCRHDQPFNGDLPMLDPMRTLTAAAREAYRLAGIKDPFQEIDVAEIYEPCSFAELAWTEALGFCGRGQGGRLAESGATSMGGSLPINPSGGVMSTNPIGATAMIRVAEAALQIMGRGGERQVPDARTAISTGFGGSWWSDVMILSRDKP